MRKVLVLSLMFWAMSVSCFGSNDWISFEKDLTFDSTEDIVLMDSVLEDQSDLSSTKLPRCWIVPIQCSCETFETQWCNEGLHGTLTEWADRICCEGCGDGCLSV